MRAVSRSQAEYRAKMRGPAFIGGTVQQVSSLDDAASNVSAVAAIERVQDGLGSSGRVEHKHGADTGWSSRGSGAVELTV